FEDTAVNLAVLSNDTDTDGNPLFINTVDGTPIAVGTPVIVNNGSVTMLANGSLDFTPTPDFAGTTSFNYTIGDGNGGTDTATATVIVTPVNDLPIADDDAYTTNEDTAITFEVRANDGDVDGQPLVVSHINGASIATGSPVAVGNGMVSIDPSGLLTFTPAANFNGVTSFSYTADDNNGGTDDAIVAITVNAQADAPVAENDAATTVETTPVLVDALNNDSDNDGDVLTIISINSRPVVVGVSIPVANGAVSLQADGRLTFQANPGYTGITQFNYTVQDGSSLSDTATVDITVLPSNAAPLAIDDNYQVNEDSSVAIDPLANDVDPEGGSVSLTTINGVAVTPGTIITVPNGVVQAGSGNSLTFVPTPDFSGVTSFAYTVADAQGATASANISVTVLSSNDGPVLVDDIAVTAEDTPVNFVPLFNDVDVDGDPLTITAINGQPVIPGSTVVVDNGTVTIEANGSATFTPATNFNGVTSFSYTASDPSGARQTARASVTVTPVNDQPDAVNDAVIGVIGQPLVLNPLGNDSDPESNPLQISQVAGQPIVPGQTISLPEGQITLLPDGRLEFVPVDDNITSVSFTYTVSDPAGETAIASVNIDLREVAFISSDSDWVELSRYTERPTLERAGEYDPVFVSPAVRGSQVATDTVNNRSVTDIDSTASDRFAWTHSHDTAGISGIPSLLSLADKSIGSRFAWVRSDNPLIITQFDPFCDDTDRNKNLLCWPDDNPESVRNLQLVLINDPKAAIATPGRPSDQPGADKPIPKAKPPMVKRTDVLPEVSATQSSGTPRAITPFTPFTRQIDNNTVKTTVPG
ncbi:MAG: Ig-like domain-containing protein, partial [Burkholderiaceae bacterium]